MCDSKTIQTFPRRFRLSRQDGFGSVMQQRPRTNAWFAVHNVINSHGHARLGISVSKRVIPTAVGRNFVKRLIRDCFRNCARHGTTRDVVIRLRKPLEKKDISFARLALKETLKMVLAKK